MKHLIVVLITLIPFSGICQNSKDTLWKSIQYSGGGSSGTITYPVGMTEYTKWKSDTARAYLLVTTRHMGMAYQKIGYVVKQWKNWECNIIYLDCDKRIIKPPFNVWQYRIIQ